MLRRFASLIRPFAPAAGAPPTSFWPFIRWVLSGGWPAISAAAAAGAFVGVLESVGALLIGWTIDRALAHGAEGYFESEWFWLGGVAIFFLILRPVSLALNAALNAVSLGPNLSPQIVARLNRHTLGQALKFFDDDFAGRLAQKQMQTATAITEIALETTNSIFFALAAVIGALLVLGQVNWELMALLAIWLVAYWRLVAWYLPRIRARATARAEARAAVTGQIVDTLSNMAVVKLFAHVGREEQGAEKALAAFRERALDFGVLAAGFRGALMLLAGFLPVMLVGGALWLWQGGGASAGDIAIAGMLSTRIAQMSGWISFTAMVIFANLGEAEDGMRTLTPPHGVTDPAEAKPLGRARGEIRFDDVTMSYGRAGGGGLDHFSLHVRPGEKVALVGRSGAGKSTALALLLRLYDVEEGRVTLDGIDVRELRQDDLRRQVAMVRQETAMFNRAAEENIRYGRPDAAWEEVVAAAREAEAHDFILELEDVKGREGYEAHLGERGVKLSGGQRQRIALARAILKDAPVLVLDEATSALDSEAEAAIQESLERLMADRTVIAVAHRLSTIARMDRIMVMENGRVAEEGSHAELVAKGGLYAGFWARQSGGFIGLEAAE